MAKYCAKCGKNISGVSKFCPECGAKTEALIEPENQPVREKDNSSVSASAESCNTRGNAIGIGNTPTANPEEKAAELRKNFSLKTEKKGFFAEIWAEMLDLLKHPQKLIPTFVLSVIWLVLPLITGFIPTSNTPVMRFFCTLTYANGGVFGGFFGTVGGIFGKAIFAAIINGFALSLFEKKNPFKGIKKGFGGVFVGGLKAISPLLIGGGAGLVLYWFFNITSSPQNCAVALVATVAALQAIGKQNGLLFGGAFYIMKRASRGKAPSKITISRILTGLSAGFAIGFALTFIRYAWVIALLGILLLGAGIVILFAGRNGVRRVSAMAVLLLMLGAIPLPFVSSAKTVNNGYWELVRSFENTAILQNDTSAENGYTEGITLKDGTYTYAKTYTNNHCSYCDHDCAGETFTAVISYSPFLSRYNDEDDVTVDLHCNGSVNGIYCNDARASIYVSAKYGETDDVFSDDFSVTVFTNLDSWMDSEAYALVKRSSNENINCESRILSEKENLQVVGSASAAHGEKNNDGDRIYFIVHILGDNVGTEIAYEYKWVQTDSTAPINDNTQDGNDTPEQGDNAVVPYNGHLTYKNGNVNKYGQPFPDLMDFDRDGDVDYDDRNIQSILAHNPDYLDTPEGGALVGAAILTAIIGAAGGAAASAAASATATAGGSALSNLTSDLDLSDDDNDDNTSETTSEEEEYRDMVRQTDKYISTDGAGDLTVRDPVNGGEKHYVKQEDGSYKQLENGRIYTKDEIRNDIAYADRNAGYYSDVESKRAQAAEYQNEHASDLSEDGKKMSEMMRREKAETERQDKLHKLGAKHGIYSGDEAEIREKMAKDQAFEEHMNQQYHEVAENIDTVVTVAETTQTVADVSLDALETVTGPTGKVINSTYKVVKGAAGKGAEAHAKGEDVTTGILQGGIEGGIDVGAGLLNGGYKAGATVAGETAKGAMDAYIKGEDVAEGAKKAT